MSDQMSDQNSETRDLLRICKEAALTARDFLRQATSDVRASVESRGRDIKLRADRESEDRVVDFLKARSNLPILTEETGWVGEGSLAGGGSAWIVDPLDGSFNYNREIPLAAVSIALWRDGRPVLGVVADIFRDEVFEGGDGLGVRLNGEPARVSSVTSMSEAVLCTGRPIASDFTPEGLARWAEDMQSFKKVRYLGSAALSLAYVASGRVDVYRESGIRVWDVAAGLALVLAAGGMAFYEPMGSDASVLYVDASNGRLARWTLASNDASNSTRGQA